MEHPEKISCNYPKLSQFKGQPWSSLTTFLNETYSSKPCEDYSITNYVKKELDTEIPQKIEMDTNNFSRFRGQPWSSWIDNLDINALTNNIQNENPDNRVIRLPRQDMGLFGICPENERFCAVVCSTCGAVVKAQALQRHLELKHTSDSETALLPPPQVPVKKTKTASVKMKNKEPVAVPLPVHSSDNVVPSFQSVVSVKQVESSTSTTSTSKSFISKVSNLSTAYDTDAYSHSLRRKSPNINNDRKSQKSREKDEEPEKHSVNEDSKQSSNRQVNNKSQLSSPRRSVTGRTKDFNKLVAEHRATKEQPSTGVTSSSKSRPQSILKTQVVTTSEAADSGFSSSSSSQSSQSTNQDTSPIIDVSPLQTSPPSPTLSLISNCTTVTSTCPDTSGTSSPTVTTTFSSSEYLVNSGSSACSSPNIVSSSSNSVNADVDTSISTSAATSTVTVSENSDSCSTTTVTSTQIVQVVPHTHTYTNAPSHSFTVKLPRSGSPIIILNNNNANVNSCGSTSESSVPQATSLPVAVSVPVPTVNLNVNTESISSSKVPVMSIPSISPHPQQPQPLVVSRDVIESLNVPVVMEMPTLSDSLTNITVYTSYPKPLVVSTFSAKKVGHAVVFSNRRLDFIRSQFKSVLEKNRRVTSALNVSMKSSQNSSTVSSAPTIFGVKTLNATTACRFPKTTTTVSGIQATSLLAHRPNILRTTSPKQTREREREQSVPKILTTGLKRPASSSPQLAGLDCKHMLLKPTANNINVSGIIGKMIVHQHEMTDSHSSEGPTTNHIALDKVVPVNIK